jgi:hypothetical protein
MNKRVWAGVCGCAMFVAGCGDDDSAASCEKSAGCGGDLVGTWKIASACFDSPPMMASMSCPGLTTTTNLDEQGTVTYRADGTYTGNLTLSGSVNVSVPASCLTQQGTTVTCAQLQESLRASAAYSSVTCTGSSGCSCVAQIAPQTQAPSGTYAVSGSTVTHSAGNSPDSNDFCVQGTTLTMTASSSSATAGTIVLTKQ